MCNVILEKYYDRIKAAYEASAFTEVSDLKQRTI